jgi:outer membrane protein assembly factor BamB
MALSGEEGYFAYGTQVYALDTKNGSLLWRFPQEGSSSIQFYAAPEVSDNLVIVGDYTSNLYAVDRENGFEKWQFNDAEDRYIASSLSYNETVYAPNTDYYLYALDENGDLLWRFKTKGPNWSKPLADESYLYLTSMDHYLYALNLSYANTDLTADEDGNQTLVSTPVWSLDLESAIVSNPVMEDGILYVGTVDGILYAVDLEKQSVLWKFTVEDEVASIWGTPVITSDAVFFGDEGGNIYAIDKQDGNALWPSPFAAGSSVIASGVGIDGKAVFAASDGKIFSIDASKEPKTLTTLDATLNAPLGYANEKIIIAPASSDALVEAIDTNGSEVWTYSPTN